MKKTALIILAAVAVAGTVSAQPQLMDPGFTPGDFLYTFDRASEALELAVARAPVIGGPALEAKVRANHAEERLAEAGKLARKNRTEKVDKLMQDYTRSVNRSISSARQANRTVLAERLRNVTSGHIQVLEQVDRKVPGPARKGVRNAIEKSRMQQRAISPGPPREVPGPTPSTPGNGDVTSPSGGAVEGPGSTPAGGETAPGSGSGAGSSGKNGLLGGITR